MAKLALIVRQLEQIIPMLGTGSEAGSVVLKTLQSLAKLVPPGAVSPGIEQSAMQNLMMKLRQQAPQIAAMRAGMGGGAGAPPGAGGAPPGGGAPPAPPQAA
jgi:hypothetical protein